MTLWALTAVAESLAAGVGEHHRPCGFAIVLVIPALVIGGLVLVPIGWLVWSLLRKPTSLVLESTPIALLAVEPLARHARRCSGVGAALALGAAIALWQADAAVFAGVPVLVAALALRRSLAARAMLGAIESHAARDARATGERVFVLTDRRAYELSVAPSALVLARRRAIPRSQLVQR